MFNQEIADEICRRLSLGETLRQICKTDDFPVHSEVCKWQNDHPHFRDQYARARSEGLDLMAEQIIEIADTPHLGVKTKTLKDGSEEVTEGDMIEHRRLQVDARKWLLSKMRPEKYGDRTVLAGDKDQPLLVHTRSVLDNPPE